VKIVVQVRLLPDAGQAPALESALRAVNEAADLVSAVAFARRVFREYALRRHVYGDLKDRGLGAQAAQHVIKKTCHAYKTLQGNIRAGNLGNPGSKRRVKAESKPITFRPDAAQPYDDRCLSWQLDTRTVSIWTTSGRLRGVRFACSADALMTLALYRHGESDLVHRDGRWFLMATCDVPEARQYEPDGFLGIDLGIANIATTSDGEIMAGRTVNRYRRRQLSLRRKLQAKGTKSAKRLLKKRARKEARFARDINHCIAKKIVTEAERTSRGIALEDLTGIRERARLRKPNGSRSAAGRSPNSGRSSSTRRSAPGCRRSTSIRPGHHAPARTAVTPTSGTASRKPGSPAGDAASLRTQTGTLPATSPPAARLPGMRGVSHAPLPLPATGQGWTRQPASPPVMP
jgi:putative transposase